MPARAGAGRRRRSALVRAFMAAAGVLSACGGSAQRAPLPPPPAIVEVEMREYAYQHPPAVPRGRVVFRVRNAGTLPHELTLVVLPEDFPPIAAQLESPSRRAVATLAFVPAQPPGGWGTFAVDLEPGRYALLCTVMDSDGILHTRKGMGSEFRVP